MNPSEWLTHLVLLSPRRIEAHLREIAASHRFPQVPNTWQLTLGVIRMWHRLAFRSETVGLCVSHRPRRNSRARLFQYRPMRFPFLLYEGAVTPLDLTGLISPPSTVIKHLLGTHHDGKQFAYDLEMLACHPGQLEELSRQVDHIVEHDDRRSRWLRDLTVYENYHERLRAAVERALTDDFGLTPAEAANPDISFGGYLAWCATQPATAGATLALARAGHYSWSEGRTDLPTSRPSVQPSRVPSTRAGRRVAQPRQPSRRAAAARPHRTKRDPRKRTARAARRRAPRGT